jgi:hypothetical protein
MNSRSLSATADRYYVVVGPQEETVIPVLDDGDGPIEIGHSVWEGFARTAKEAKALAWKHFRAEGARFLDDNYPGHPMRGVTVERVPPCPNHGYDFESCLCTDCDDCGLVQPTEEGDCPKCGAQIWM